MKDSRRRGPFRSCARRWVTVEADESCSLRLARALDAPLPAARALAGRGITTSEQAQSFLAPRLSNLSDPFDLPNMEPAVERIWRAVRQKERIVIFGDYDADGVTGTAILVLLLRRLGGQIQYFLPNRLKDGYGLTTGALERCLTSHQPNLLITVDCGTGASEAFDLAKRSGCDVVVTDHHEPVSGVSDPVWVVNPKLESKRTAGALAGVGVAFKLGHALVKHGLAANIEEVKSVDLREWLDLVAVGTVSDIVPLTDENRILVSHGLSRLSHTACEGMKALLRVSGLDGEVTAYHLGFVLGPRLNAAGRLGHASTALELLLATNRLDADRLAIELDDANEKRKRIEDQIAEEAGEEVDRYFDEMTNFGLTAGRRGWHTGMIGIVASRLCSRYRRPVVVIGFDESGQGRGSCRSLETVDILEILRGCADLLVTYGGHAAAAGIVIGERNLGPFKERFNRLCADKLKDTDLRPVQRVDAWLSSLGEADERLLASSSRFAPFGHGNPAPVWGVRDVQVLGAPSVVGKDHLRMTVAAGGTQMEAIAFGMAGREWPAGNLDLLFHLEADNYAGQKRRQLKVRDFRAAEA